jgi:peptidoglycan/xylan/chitin deacetylase (PgdA/CDA1 family)
MKPARYGPFPYSPIIERPPIRWPGDAGLALWVIPNVEFFALDEKVPPQAGGGDTVPDIPTWSVRDYGNRVGFFRLMAVLDRYGIRATVALNSDLCAEHPQLIRAGVERGWEFMGHNQSNTRRLNGVPPQEEHGIIKGTLDTIERSTGVRPKGWLSSGLQETWESLDLLAAEGCGYVADWVNDDLPYVMELEEGRNLVSVPYSYSINDKPAFEVHHRTADEFEAMIKAQFDVLWREGTTAGRVMAIALHPYIIGAPHRIGALDRALEHICRHEGVWLATGNEIAEHFLSIAERTIR